ncbi:lathosterol oxidase-like [Patiria miniata]|uniref:Fatty acid hydroxylase domain-containing protein n=1 Tax=Patiria miniata TaxID=46514 RepID=A0A914B3G8_PATMI|nr:lathosterol oxidase-like [Patiria miniata]
MDLVVDVVDTHFCTKYNIYPNGWTEDYWLRQLISLYFIFYFGALLIYFVASALVFFFVFDHRLMKHPLFLKNQIRREIWQSVTGGLGLVVFTVVTVFPELHGYAKLYTLDEVGATGSEAILLITRDVVGLIFFSDCFIYWIHRFLHHRYVYRHLHKQHHMWKIPTPFASIAFHPLDGYLQSVPYHVYTYLFPLNKHAFLVMFVLVNAWTISIHDGDSRVPAFLRPFINGSAHHTDHHLYYNYNYGQYFTLWDRIGGSYRNPSVYEGSSLVDAVNKKSSKLLDGDECNGDECNGHDKAHKG